MTGVLIVFNTGRVLRLPFCGETKPRASLNCLRVVITIMPLPFSAYSPSDPPLSAEAILDIAHHNIILTLRARPTIGSDSRRDQPFQTSRQTGTAFIPR
jgi:hypothetical protein